MFDPISTIIGCIVYFFSLTSPDPIGTGFYIAYPNPNVEGKGFLMIVTAKHVICNHDNVIIRYSDKNGKTLSSPLNLSQFRKDNLLWEHPDEGVDLVLSCGYSPSLEYLAIKTTDISKQEEFTNGNIRPTFPITFPGLLINFPGTIRNFPVARNGTIAQIPQEKVPLQYNFNGKIVRTKQNILLVNGDAFPGASGSPVFLGPGVGVKKGNYEFINDMSLIGIISGFYPASPREIEEIKISETTRVFQENSGMAIVIPSYRILEILEIDAVKQYIEKQF